jgi:alkylation response protein AidB-like acyl-CoA dehydrogenase
LDFELSEEQRHLVDSVREVLARECPPARARAVVETGRPAEQPWRAARELGWTAIAVPQSAGGLGLSFLELGLVIELHGLHLAPGPFLASTAWLAPLVREAGSRAQRADLLGRLARGALTGTAAFGTGFDRPDEALRAVREGSGWRLHGTRRFVLDGESADEVAVAARVEEGDGCGLFLLPRRAAKSERVTSLDASRPVAHLVFDGAAVPPERALGEPGAVAAAFARAREEATVALALETVGTCQRLLELALGHARHREQFDRPIGSFQAVQHKCVDMFVQVQKARATAWFAMLAVAEDDPRRALAASMAKAAAGDCQRLVCKEALQIHGGMGFTWESDVHLFVKRAMTAELLLGTASEHRARVADLLEM